jgi:hypothetical protein
MDVLQPIHLIDWNAAVPAAVQQKAVEALECGRVLFFPSLTFEIGEAESDLVSERLASGKAKNISFDAATGALRGTGADRVTALRLAAFMSRFVNQARALMRNLLPIYTEQIETGRTSFRPVEIRGRASSPRKDDTRLHVDSFPATPVRGRRILRLFSNINPGNQERVWRVGEPFESVAKTFLPRGRMQYRGEAGVLRVFRITKTSRSEYDHLMLQLHNLMKADDQYQSGVQQTEVRFPAGTTWLTYTDQVSHAAMSGQHCLEQTFYLPVAVMADPSRSPISILERLCGRPLL